MANNSKALYDKIDWDRRASDLADNGFTVVDKILTASDCKNLIDLYKQDSLYRSTIDMKRYNFGKGSYRYFKYPLPPTIQTLRETIYEKLSATANRWAERSKVKFEYPKKFSDFAKEMKSRGQTRPTPLILKYGKDDYNCLHQDINNELFFPYQIVFGLSESGRDYEGGQLLLTQQRPRMQTIPYLVKIPKGGAVIFTSNIHPVQGKRGYYRSIFRHGVCKIESGSRYTMGIVFHDYIEKQ
jgi:uncharacterized protein